jgi:hypothetical protein
MHDKSFSIAPFIALLSWRGEGGGAGRPGCGDERFAVPLPQLMASLRPIRSWGAITPDRLSSTAPVRRCSPEPGADRDTGHGRGH